MEKDKIKVYVKQIIPELGCMILIAGFVLLLSWILKKPYENTLRIMVMGVIGIAVIGYHYRKQFNSGELFYDNNEHYMRFWICLGIGILVAGICVFLPVGGWPFLVIYVLLALFTNTSTGILAGTVLMLIPIMMNGAEASAFFLYFVSGVFAITLFYNMSNDFHIGIPLTLSVMCLLVCETANVILPANTRLSLESFVVPVTNIVISSILLILSLNFFSTLVIYKYRDRYLELNDSENTLLSEYKENARNDYFHSIHTAYFCERIAKKLEFDPDALKCAGYYHKFGDKLNDLYEQYKFPPNAVSILKEYNSKHCTKKETAVLVCSDMVISSVLLMISKNKDEKLNYDNIIDAVFKHIEEKHTFKNCDLSIKDLHLIHNIFKEEKLYYDFLR